MVMTCTLGSLPAGTSVQKNADGSISVGGKKLPPGTSVQTNPDGTLSVSGKVPDIPINLKKLEGKNKNKFHTLIQLLSIVFLGYFS